MLPLISKHPLSLLRCPSGIDAQCFYQRNPGKGLGPDVHPFEFKHQGKKYEYLDIEDEKGLLELVQMGAEEALESLLKCTGGKGLHVIVPLAAMDQWPRVKSFAASIAKELTSATPDAYIDTMSKAKRGGKIFVDYLRNDYTATAIADYSVRARPGAPVAVPLHWNELGTLNSADAFKIKDVLRRLAHKRPPASSPKLAQRIPQ